MVHGLTVVLMPAASLDDFMALNDQLAALLQAGVPIDVGLGRSRQETLTQLQHINAGVARRVAQGSSLDAALEQEDTATAAYRGVMQVGLQSGNLPAALVGQNQLAQEVQRTQEAVGRGLLYPLIVCALAYAGLVIMCFTFVPTLENLYRSLSIRPGWSLELLDALSETLSVWIAIPPAVVLLLVFWRRAAAKQASSTGNSWLPGMAQAIYWQHCANLADRLATLLEAGIPIQQALAMTAPTAGDPDLVRGADEFLAQASAGGTQTTGIATASRLPPLLRWVLSHSAQTTGTPPGLRMAARWYRSAAARRAEQIRVAAPLVASIVIGGTAALLYGLALFVPLMQLYRQLAQ